MFVTCLLRFPHKNDVRLCLPPVVIFTLFACVCIVVSNTYCVVVLFCFSSSLFIVFPQLFIKNQIGVERRSIISDLRGPYFDAKIAHTSQACTHNHCTCFRTVSLNLVYQWLLVNVQQRSVFQLFAGREQVQLYTEATWKWGKWSLESWIWT